jgi:hypothetical protein
MNEYEGKPARQDAHRNPRQDEKGPNDIERRAVLRPVVLRGGRTADRAARR